MVSAFKVANSLTLMPGAQLVAVYSCCERKGQTLNWLSSLNGLAGAMALSKSQLKTGRTVM